MYQSHEVKLKVQRTNIVGEVKVLRIVLDCLHGVSPLACPLPSDRNITGKKIKCLNKIHKNVELYDYKIIFALYITIVTCVLAPAAAS